MSSNNILRSIVATQFSVDTSVVRVSGYIAELQTYKDWYGCYQSENGFTFKKIESFTPKAMFLVSLYKGKVTVHNTRQSGNHYNVGLTYDRSKGHPSEYIYNENGGEVTYKGNHYNVGLTYDKDGGHPSEYTYDKDGGEVTYKD